MRIPYMAVALAVLAAANASQGQVASSPTQLVHPILKDPNNRNAPTSLDRDPSLLEDTGQPHGIRQTASRPGAPAPALPALSAQPVPIVAKIDAGLVASKLSLMGTVTGLKGTIYVTNLGASEVTPLVQVAVCDTKGFKLGSVSKSGEVLAPNAGEKIVLVATNLNAADLKLMRLTSLDAKEAAPAASTR